MTIPALPAGVSVFERGWLSANNILLRPAPGLCGSEGTTALIDTGYCTHATQTVALVEQALGAQPLDLVLNTHLHSDHCGGNAALQARYPAAQLHIPPGQARFVEAWNPDALSYTPTGQQCPPFKAHALLQPGQDIQLGAHRWHIHAAPGHDPHSVVLFEPQARVLVSADALWHNGFGAARSHGCVNMSPPDARWFYHWTEPHVPSGWSGAYADAQHPGTRVYVHYDEQPLGTRAGPLRIPQH